MNESNLAYSIVQFSPRPERYEFVNVGVLVFDMRHGLIEKKFSSDFARVKRLFGDASPSFLKMALEDFAERVDFEFRKLNYSISAAEFNSRRSGIFQITPILPISGKNASQAASDLFADLVAGEAKNQRLERVSTRLKRAFADAGVLSLLQARPRAVEIPKWGVSIKADFGYQNGVYNLIDSARFDQSERGLAEAGKRVLEGRALAETLDHRLIVVGEFADHSGGYVDSLREEFEKANSKLFSLEEVGALAQEIRRAAH
ncbi:DUF3037 domain-containing protein [Pannonibacter phragmitetus]|uniref:DUF3037 domain-containing protein n=1 Tax=Pannonibacter phragmitetus TaxID=121719 RepID=UPI000F017134|nr:DUF3037 domain-containing protein [Pannonibacter phragmitetus]MBA4207283.1 DUF3037 domain-containing protein [Polymorphum sp.]